MLLGITGGIGSGKTTASRYLEGLGCIVVDADRINRELSEPGGPIWIKIRKQFGETFLLPDGKIDKIQLGALVFNDSEKRKILEEISHPLIIREENRRIQEIRQSSPKRVIVLEASLLIEAGEHKRVDKLIVVTADRERRLEWLVQERGIPREAVEKRIKAQMSCEERMQFADYVIHNNGTKVALKKQVARLFAKIRGQHKTRIS